ncbi:MAG: ssDNA endodeoxyribonuclease [Trichoglossum hirsutum]|nr:MAG: ssDNA endodeoxyribonuclease [Trichoglossum hirsutum]
MASASGDNVPIFSAVSSSARQLFLLLRCVGFAAKAQVQITKEGLRFTVEESRVMQGLAFLDKALFTTYNYLPPPSFPNLRTSTETSDGTDEDDNGDDDDSNPSFQISLYALLECLQIFGVDSKERSWGNNGRDGVSNFSRAGSMARGGSVFDNRVLGMAGVCRLSYAGTGAPFCLILEEAGVTTTCELVTYEPEIHYDIPLRRDSLAQKIIMKASWLHDAITELSSTSPTRLTIVASPQAPYFALSATGPLGSATVQFSRDPQLLETFSVTRRCVNTYKYSLIKAASRAMAIASKVSIRGDDVGVLSLQFMIEVEGGGVSFVDFRFVPFVAQEGEEDEEGENEEEDSLYALPE